MKRRLKDGAMREIYLFSQLDVARKVLRATTQSGTIALTMPLFATAHLSSIIPAEGFTETASVMR